MTNVVRSAREAIQRFHDERAGSCADLFRAGALGTPMDVGAGR